MKNKKRGRLKGTASREPGVKSKQEEVRSGKRS
jgi:hypothetical protein